MKRNLLLVLCCGLVCLAKAEDYDELEFANAAASGMMPSSSILDRDMPQPVILECGDKVKGGQFKDSNELSPFSFTSPGFPDNYPKKSKCQVTIQVPKGKRMHMVFFSVDIHTSKPNKCKGDYLKIQVKGEPYKEFFCGQFNSSHQSIGPFNKNRKVVFQFKSNNDNKSGRGFVMAMLANLMIYPLGPFACGKYVETFARAGLERSQAPMIDFDRAEANSIKAQLSARADPDVGGLVGGQLADPHEYPWQVLVYDSVKFSVCGGTLISPQWVLTAYHCIDQSIENATNFLVFLNDTNIYNGNDDGSFVVGVSDVKVMNVSGFPFYDVALVKMSSSLNFFTPDVYPACLPGPDYVYEPGTILTTSGWGSITNKTGSLSPNLMELDLELQSQEACAARAANALGGTYPAEFIICAGEPGVGICPGDSGGPLVDDLDGYSIVLGVTSFFLNECAASPSFFANVATAAGWIYQTVNDI